MTFRQGLRVLLAEDNPISRTLVRVLLSRMGCAVETCPNGEEAVRMSGEGHFDLVLMDLMMPVMDGSQATSAIRERERLGATERTPILGLTASAEEADRRLCLGCGMDGMLPKPFTEDDLTAALKNIAET